MRRRLAMRAAALPRKKAGFVLPSYREAIAGEWIRKDWPIKDKLASNRLRDLCSARSDHVGHLPGDEGPRSFGVASE